MNPNYPVIYTNYYHHQSIDRGQGANKNPNRNAGTDQVK
jgi:hypothetical protein